MKNNEKQIRSDNKKLLNTVLLYVAVVAVAFLVFFAVKTWVISNYSVRQQSMEPTLKEKDIVWASKIKKPDYGDIVLVKVRQNGEEQIYIKRAVAFGGDLIWVEQSAENKGAYYLCRQKKGTLTEERLVEEQYDGTVLDMMNILNLPERKDDNNLKAIGKENAILVPENSVYCLGDNRNNSLDSGELGAFAEDDLIGVIVGKGMTAFWIIASVIALVLFVLSFISLKKSSDKKEENDILNDLFSEEDKLLLKEELLEEQSLLDGEQNTKD